MFCCEQLKVYWYVGSQAGGEGHGILVYQDMPIAVGVKVAKDHFTLAIWQKYDKLMQVVYIYIFIRIFFFFRLVVCRVSDCYHRAF